MFVLTDEITTPLWLTIVLSLASGLVVAIITLVVQFIIEKRKVKKDLFLTLVSYRDCSFNDGCVKNAMNQIQIVFYHHKKVISTYESFIKAISEQTFTPNQTILIDEFILLLEAMADVVGYKTFNWERIKKKYTSVCISDELESDNAVINNVSSGVVKKKSKKNDGDTSIKK